MYSYYTAYLIPDIPSPIFKHVKWEYVSTYCLILQRVHAYKMDERENDKIKRLFLQ